MTAFRPLLTINHERQKPVRIQVKKTSVSKAGKINE